MLRRFFSVTILCLLGFLLSLTLNFFKLPLVVAENSITEIRSEIVSDLALQEQKGRDFYQQGNFLESIIIWQQARENYKNQGNKIAQASLLSNISLAYQKLGKWHEAKQALEESFTLLETEISTKDYVRVYGQILNNQGLLQLAQGQAAMAYDSWREAEKLYGQLKDSQGVFRTKVNQSLALKYLGLYPRACNTLIEVLELSPFSCESPKIQTGEQRQKNQAILKGKLNQDLSSLDSMHFIAWLKFANILRDHSFFQESKFILESLKNIKSGAEKAQLLLSLGKLAQVQNNSSDALFFYQNAIINATNSITKIQGQLAQLRIYILTEQWSQAEDLVPILFNDLQSLPPSQTNLYTQINFLHNLILLSQANQEQKLRLSLPQLQEIALLANQVIQQARDLGDKSSESYGLGILGAIYKQAEQWLTAQQLTEQALLIAQSINSPEIAYRWQWQLGAIFRANNNLEQAVIVYSEAIKNLQLIQADLVAIGEDIQFSFQSQVEPVYREFISLLLTPDNAGHISQKNLLKAQETMEALQLAELDNFFQEACLEAQPQTLDTIDANAAIIYPIILPKRLAVLLKLPGQPISYYFANISPQQLEQVVQNFRYNLVVRSRRDFFANGQQLYQWLIAPFEEKLEAAEIKTLVFVPDSFLRNIPLNALYDGKQYLIEKGYSISVNSGLQLIEPKSLQTTNLLTLGAGVTEKQTIENIFFPPLPYIQQELRNIKAEVPSYILLNQDFTLPRLNDRIKQTNFSIVHLATHGQFSSDFEETYLVSWSDKINILQLEQLLKQNNQQAVTIELLVLSACETASGDERAALGLAGMALRSGARSTLATLWSVNDQASAEFMGHFYKILGTPNLTKAEVVRQAQLQLLANPRYEHPFYWAAYTLVGNWL